MMLWVLLLFGILQVAACLYVLPNGSYYRGFPVPAWGVVIQLVVGMIIAILSLRAILRGEGKFKKSSTTDEEVAAAKAEMDRLHLKIYGVPPERPGDTKESGPKDRARTEKE